MQVAPRRTGEWWISPAIPAVANAALVALWIFTAFGGWGEQAFCGVGGAHDPTCATGFENAVLASLAVVVPAVAITVAALALRRVRHHPDRLGMMLAASAFLWVSAEGILFLGGYLAQSA
ncbi:hypothetical protein [Actinomadura algeriensis]|uniref:Uncharacterized protein n=1 Tax=Actinomadura algeriensis TaxID=1679523 RepID=A0ABR9JT34_9ACTN|nr:hypothetical protein [Actinomadura algeriensis]MBE1533538.1 hypothetical protein [Actinomadura algeriensis]